MSNLSLTRKPDPTRDRRIQRVLKTPSGRNEPEQRFDRDVLNGVVRELVENRRLHTLAGWFGRCLCHDSRAGSEQPHEHEKN